MQTDQAQRVRAIVEKVRVFRRLSVPEAGRLLQSCTYRSYDRRETIYEADDPSEEMLILLQGRLLVTSKSGRILSRVDPGNTVGEMGVFTGERRTANVVAEEKSSGFVVSKQALQTLLMAGDKLKLKIYENLIGILCERLRATNEQLEAIGGEDSDG